MLPERLKYQKINVLSMSCHRSTWLTPAERVLKEALDRFPELHVTLAKAPDADEMVRGVVRAIDRIPGQTQ